MPLIIFDDGNFGGELNEFDACSMCGEPTSQLVWVRMGDMLPGICGPCIDAVKLGYERMLSQRRARMHFFEETDPC